MSIVSVIVPYACPVFNIWLEDNIKMDIENIRSEDADVD
jgi:hypothetical protein